MVCHYTRIIYVVSFSANQVGGKRYYTLILGIMAHHTTTVWYRFKLPFETAVLPFETVLLPFQTVALPFKTVVLLFQNGTTFCLKQDWSCFEMEVLPFRYRDCTLARYLYYHSGSSQTRMNWRICRHYTPAGQVMYELTKEGGS